jgi:hypothetical protein
VYISKYYCSPGNLKLNPYQLNLKVGLLGPSSQNIFLLVH